MYDHYYLLFNHKLMVGFVTFACFATVSTNIGLVVNALVVWTVNSANTRVEDSSLV